MDRGVVSPTGLADATEADRRFALAILVASALFFVALAPFAKVAMPKLLGFIPVYQFPLAINDGVTAVLLYLHFAALRMRAILLLASAYLFSAVMAVVHVL